MKRPKTPTDKTRPYTAREDKIILRMTKEGRSNPEIVAALPDRSYYSIATRKHILRKKNSWMDVPNPVIQPKKTNHPETWMGRSGKETTRSLIAYFTMERALRIPIRMLSLPGRDFATELYFHWLQMPLDFVLGVENDEEELEEVASSHKKLPEDLRRKIKIFPKTPTSVRDVLQPDTKQRQSYHVNQGFDLYWLDFMCGYGSIEDTLFYVFRDQEAHKAAFERFGSFRLFICVQVAGTPGSGNSETLRETAQELAQYNPPIPKVSKPEEQVVITSHYERVFGIHHKVQNLASFRNYILKPLCSVLYRDPVIKEGKAGAALMLFMGFDVSPCPGPIGDARTAPLEPVFVGIEKWEELPHTKTTLAQWESLGIFNKRLKPEEVNLKGYIDALIKLDGIPEEEIYDIVKAQMGESAARQLTDRKVRILPKEEEENPIDCLLLSILRFFKSKRKHKISSREVDSHLEKKHSSMKSKVENWSNKIAWAKRALTTGGYTLPSTKSGVVELTPKGKKLIGKLPKSSNTICYKATQGNL